MDAGLTSALAAAALTGIWFSTTRWISIGALTLLCFFHPWLTAFVACGVGWAFFFFKVRKP